MPELAQRCCRCRPRATNRSSNPRVSCDWEPGHAPPADAQHGGLMMGFGTSLNCHAELLPTELLPTEKLTAAVAGLLNPSSKKRTSTASKYLAGGAIGVHVQFQFEIHQASSFVIRVPSGRMLGCPLAIWIFWRAHAHRAFPEGSLSSRAAEHRHSPRTCVSASIQFGPATLAGLGTLMRSTKLVRGVNARRRQGSGILCETAPPPRNLVCFRTLRALALAQPNRRRNSRSGVP